MSVSVRTTGDISRVRVKTGPNLLVRLLCVLKIWKVEDGDP